MPKILRVLLIAFGSMLLVAMTGFALLFWMFGVHTPDLTPAQAKVIISNTSEFGQSRSLVRVFHAERCGDSLQNSCYTAEFTFTQKDVGRTVKGQAEFRYWNGAWHLQNFSFGELPNVETVWVTSDVPKGASF